MVRSALLVVLVGGCVGGGDSGDSAADTGPGSGCTPATDASTTAIVTDIDETLTTDDTEWLHQIIDPDYDPAMRPDADALMNGYHDLGYRVFYITARGESLGLVDGTSARDATEGWLEAHDFPYSSGDVYLADGLGATGDSAVDYKSGVILDLMGSGVSVVWAYGNADTDVEAYQAAGIPDDHIFLVGDLAGEYGVEAIPTADAYTSHMAAFLPTVPCAG